MLPYSIKEKKKLLLVPSAVFSGSVALPFIYHTIASTLLLVPSAVLCCPIHPPYHFITLAHHRIPAHLLSKPIIAFLVAIMPPLGTRLRHRITCPVLPREANSWQGHESLLLHPVFPVCGILQEQFFIWCSSPGWSGCCSSFSTPLSGLDHAPSLLIRTYLCSF